MFWYLLNTSEHFENWSMLASWNASSSSLSRNGILTTKVSAVLELPCCMLFSVYTILCLLTMVWLDFTLCAAIYSHISWQIKRARNNCIHQTWTYTLAIQKETSSFRGSWKDYLQATTLSKGKMLQLRIDPHLCCWIFFQILCHSPKANGKKLSTWKQKNQWRKRPGPATILRREFLRRAAGYVQILIPNNNDHPETSISNTNSTRVKGFPEAPLFKGVTIQPPLVP